MPEKQEIYLGNPNLKRANVNTSFSPEEVQEFIKCSQDPVYFIRNYIKIVNLDEGIVNFDLYDFQEDMVNRFHEHRFNIAKLPRQSGKSTVVTAYLLWYAIFNDNVNIAILANKAATAREMLGRLQLSYENLPKWLQQGVVNWNRGSLELENGSKILAASTSASAVRGMSFNIIFLDEFAFIPTHIADEFFSSVYPTISSGKKTKVIIISTPKGMNMFYKLWHDAEKGQNEYTTTEVHWQQVPGRDQVWKEQTIKNTSEEQFNQEFECEFLGSVNTLISSTKLKTLVYEEPKRKEAGLSIYDDPEEGHSYHICVDVARGLTKDYSAFTVIDTTEIPYQVVAKYRNNTIKPLLFPDIIHRVATAYNQAYIMIEVNDIGGQVADIIQFDLEYENLLMCAMRGRAGQVVGQGFSGTKVQMGVKMSTTVKKTGCSNLKQLIEDDKLVFKDYDIMAEMTTFIQRGPAWEAEEGCNDDLVMCLVIFSWLATTDYFRELHDDDVRMKMYKEQKEGIEADMAPFGFIDDGVGYDQEAIVDDEGTTWNVDEYGDKAYMWDYLS